ncbi:MAG: hypothetical protein IAG10_06865 [Planctomycetaceae bacterium]|nr:hypothetical protein [Planctomycetaceae bacterium]
MADRILIQCPGCSAKLAISDESKLGKKIRCSKCSEVFVAKALKSSGSKSGAPTKAAKPKKSDDDEFNFDDMEMEDKSELDEEESEEESRPVKAKSGKTKKGAKGKKKSGGSNLPLIIGGVVAVVLLLGVGGYFLFSGGEGAPAAAPNQPVAQQPGVVPAGVMPNAGGPVLANAPPTTPVVAGNVPPTAASPTAAVPTTAAPSIATAKIAEANLATAQRLGETAEVAASDTADLPAGTKGLTARTRWYWMASAFEASGAEVEVIELVVDVQGDLLPKIIGFGHAEFKTLTAPPDQSLRIFQTLIKSWFDPVTYYVPYEHNSTSGLSPGPGHPEGVLRIGIPFVAPKVAATHLEVVEGQFKIKTAQMMEEIVIPDVRTAANKPLEHPSLKAAEAMLSLKAQKNPAGQMSEVLEFQFGRNYAVGPLLAKAREGQMRTLMLQPDVAADPNGHHFSSRGSLSLPGGPLTMTIKLYSQIEEFVVPFRFENVPLPSPDKKPKKK